MTPIFSYWNVLGTNEKSNALRLGVIMVQQDNVHTADMTTEYPVFLECCNICFYWFGQHLTICQILLFWYHKIRLHTIMYSDYVIVILNW